MALGWPLYQQGVGPGLEAIDPVNVVRAQRHAFTGEHRPPKVLLNPPPVQCKLGEVQTAFEYDGREAVTMAVDRCGVTGGLGEALAGLVLMKPDLVVLTPT